MALISDTSRVRTAITSCGMEQRSTQAGGPMLRPPGTGS